MQEPMTSQEPPESPRLRLHFGLLGRLVVAAATPSCVFVLLHHVYQYADAPEWRPGTEGPSGALFVVAAIAYFGAVVAGPALTLLATVGGVVATFRRSVTASARVVLWTYLALSWLSVWLMNRHVRW